MISQTNNENVDANYAEYFDENVYVEKEMQ